MNIVIVGAGNIGTPLIEVATTEGNEVIVIERDPEKAEAIASAFDCLVVNDDATSKETLLDAGVGRADAVISTTEQDATNIMVCLLATELDVPDVVSVVHNPEHMELFSRIGVHAMENPQQLIAESLYRSVAQPAIVDYMRVGETAEVFEITVTEDAPIAGKTLTGAAAEELLPADVLIVAVERGGEDAPITPRGDTRIEAGDLLTVYSAVGTPPEITDIFGQ